ncbi:response regulator [Mesorhizobium sp. 128a]
MVTSILSTISGPDLQRELALNGQGIPIVYITAQREESLRQRLLASGAVACLLKPFSDTALSEGLNSALRTG